MRKDIIISLNGQEGSGKSTIATMLAEKLNIPRFYMGQIFRDMAAEKGITMVELRKICEKDSSIDRELDDHVIALPEKNPSFVIESRTAWHFIPQSIKIYLQVDSKIAAERIFKNLSEKNNRGNEDATLDCVENIEQSILKRRSEDSERYFSFYGIRQDEISNYDLVVDTTNLTIEEVFEKIINFIDEKSS